MLVLIQNLVFVLLTAGHFLNKVLLVFLWLQSGGPLVGSKSRINSRCIRAFPEEAIERTTYTTILALPWFWQFWNGALIVVILNPLMCPLMPLGWLWRASKFIKVSFCLERMNYWKGDFYVLYCPNQNVLYKSPLVSYLFIEVNRKRNKRRLYHLSELLLTSLEGLNLTYTNLKTNEI